MYSIALTDLNKSLKIQKNIFALKSRAEIYSSIKRNSKAILDLDMALVVKPQDVFVIIHRAKIYCLLELYDNALKDLNYALELNTSNVALILANRGDIY